MFGIEGRGHGCGLPARIGGGCQRRHAFWTGGRDGLAHQAKFLRVLEEQEVQRLGRTANLLAVDVRVTSFPLWMLAAFFVQLKMEKMLKGKPLIKIVEGDGARFLLYLFCCFSVSTSCQNNTDRASDALLPVILML